MDFPYPTAKTKWAVFPYKVPYKLQLSVCSKIIGTLLWDMGLNSYVSKAFFHNLQVCFMVKCQIFNPHTHKWVLNYCASGIYRITSGAIFENED